MAKKVHVVIGAVAPLVLGAALWCAPTLVHAQPGQLQGQPQGQPPIQPPPRGQKPVERGTPGDAAPLRVAPAVKELQEKASQATDAATQLDLLQQALTKARELNDKPGEARTLSLLGRTYQHARQWDKALENLTAAQSLYHTLGTSQGEGLMFYAIGTVYRDMQQLPKALDALAHAIPLLQAAGDRDFEATATGAAGTLCMNLRQNQQAAEYLTRALSLYRDAQKRPQEAAVLLNIGINCANSQQWQQSLDAVSQALPMFRELGNKPQEAKALSCQGVMYQHTGQPGKAAQSLEQAALLSHELNDQEAASLYITHAAFLYFGVGESARAIECYERARPWLHESGDQRGESELLLSLGIACREAGAIPKAFESLNQALALSRALDDHKNEANELDQLGGTYGVAGQPQKALQTLSEALALHTKTGDGNESASLSITGGIYAALGQPEKALDFYLRSLALHIKNSPQDWGNRAAILNNIGTQYDNLGQPAQALNYYNQSLVLSRSLHNRAQEAGSLVNVGFVNAKLRDLDYALSCYQQALTIVRELGNQRVEAKILTNIGVTYFASGQNQRAVEFLKQALPLHHAAYNLYDEVSTLGALADSESRLSQFAQAEAHYRAGLAILESIRASLGALDQAKISFLQLRIPTYYSYIDFLLRRQRPTEAFAWAQKTKARALLDLMLNGRVDLSRSLNPAERAQERQLRAKVDAANQGLVVALSQSAPPTRVTVLRQRLSQSQKELQTFTDALYVKYPNVARQRAAKTVTLPEVGAFLPPDTALLEYVTLDTGEVSNITGKTVLFCVTVAKGRVQLRAYPIARTRQQLSQDASAFIAATRKPKGNYQKQARALYDLLIAPAEAQLQGKGHLVICPDGPLWGIPFASLLLPGASHTTKVAGKAVTKTNDPQFLLERYRLSYAYSATAMQAARAAKDARHLHPTQPALGIANPLFALPGEVTGKAGKRPIVDTSRPIVDTSRGIVDTSRGIIDTSRPFIDTSREVITGQIKPLPPLPGTLAEANALRRDFPNATIRTGAQAQEPFVKAHAGDFRYLHFATHGLFNDTAPLLSAVVLATPPLQTSSPSKTTPAPPATSAVNQEPDAASPEPDTDGFLTAREIFDLRLSADLVVLSACDTARGTQHSGEGVIGLTWALFVAGAPSQVVSQWQVNDESTALLMERFYAQLKGGQSKDAALRNAELSLLHNKQYRHPYYWSPFILMGEWR